MPSKIDVSQLTLNPEEAQEVSELIFEKEFVNGVLSEDHVIETGIQWNKQIVFVGRLEDSLIGHTGCTPEEGGELPLTEKFWTPGKFSTRFTHCADDLDILFKVFGKAVSNNPDFYNIIDSEDGKLLMARVGMMLREKLPAKVWFSDAAATAFVDGGNFTDGSNLNRYNVITGLWPQIRAEIGGGDSNYVEILQNSEASYADQILTPQQSFDYLQDTVDRADPRLVGDSSAAFYVTRTVADAYRRYLRENTVSSGFTEITENGKRILMFDGYPVKIKYEWDDVIRRDQNNIVDGVYYQPNRILFTTPSNIPIGTLREEDLEKINAFYYEFGLQAVLDVIFSLDAKFLEPYMAVAAY